MTGAPAVRPARGAGRGGGATLVLVGGVTTWAAHFGATYLLLTLACAGVLAAPGSWLAAVTVTAALLAGGGALWAGRRAGRAGTDAERFLLAAGAVANGFVTGLVALEGVALVVLGGWCPA